MRESSKINFGFNFMKQNLPKVYLTHLQFCIGNPSKFVSEKINPEISTQKTL